MKSYWLNLVLSLTNKIYNRKQLIIGQVGLGAVANIAILILSEMALGVVSLPLYLTLKSDKVTAYFKEKGSYAKVNFDYNLRRILTVTGVGIVAFFWAIKLSLILFLPVVYGPLQLYTVSDLRPADILAKDLVATETGLQTARVISSLAHPELGEVKKLSGGDYRFSGTGQPNTTVVLLLSDIQTAIYSAPVSNRGEWQIDHQQKNFRLGEGNHSVLIFSYDAKNGVRSETAPEQFFRSRISWLDQLAKSVDILANWSIVIFILLGVFLIFLTI